jgi:Na+-translocating ferredoxin:NAD+ oxidoreductase RNF subunit RnfB
MEANRQSVEIRLEVDFAREASAGAAECLISLPPFASAAETCARTTVLSNICTNCAVRLHPASASKKALNTPVRLRRQNRFQTLFQWPNSIGNARHVML